MKFVLQQWWANKLALFFLACETGVNILQAWFMAMVVTPGLLRLVNGTPEYLSEHEANMILLLMGAVLIDSARPIARSAARITFFTNLLKDERWKVVFNDGAMFQVFGADNMISARKSVWNVTELGDHFANIFIHTGWIIFSLCSIGKVCIALLPIPFALFGIATCAVLCLTRCINNIAKENTERIQKRDAEDLQTINGYQEVRANAIGERHIESLAKQDEAINKLMFRRSYIVSALFGVYSAFDAISKMAAIHLGVKMVADGVMSPAGLNVIFNNLERIGDRIDSLFDTADAISTALGELEPLVKIYEWVNEMTNGDSIFGGFQKGDVIELTDVRQTYKKNGTVTEVLKGVSMLIKQGGVYGICGRSGCGKSTLIKLILRLIPPTTGTVKIGGIDISEFTPESLFRHFGTVFQDVSIFKGTLWENLTYFVPEASESQVLEACRIAGILELVRDAGRCPDGFQTKVGPRGVDLSGGEKQRIGIARAILKNPDILILDEGTSALDNIVEAEVLQNILEWAAKRHATVIMIAHRLTTLRKCDEIFYMEDGRICEAGSFRSLLQRNGGFATLWKVANFVD